MWVFTLDNSHFGVLSLWTTVILENFRALNNSYFEVLSLQSTVL